MDLPYLVLGFGYAIELVVIAAQTCVYFELGVYCLYT